MSRCDSMRHSRNSPWTGNCEFPLAYAPSHQPAAGAGRGALAERAAVHSGRRRLSVLFQRAACGESRGQAIAGAGDDRLDACIDLAFEEDERSGEYLLWNDTRASLERLLTALAISALIGVTLGVAIGVLPYVRHALAPFVAALSLIPPLAILPILFIVVGLGELAKITLIIIGVAPVVVRDLAIANRRAAGRANHQGANSGGLHLAIGAARRPAADVAASDRCAASHLGLGMAVSHRRGSHRLDRRIGISDISRAPLSRHGRHPAVCRMDHRACVYDGLAAAAVARQGLCVGQGRRRP